MLVIKVPGNEGKQEERTAKFFPPELTQISTHGSKQLTIPKKDEPKESGLRAANNRQAEKERERGISEGSTGAVVGQGEGL